MSASVSEVAKSSLIWRVALIVLICVAALAIILIGTIFVLKYNYQNRIFPGVNVSSVDLGGLTKTQAQDILTGEIKSTFGNGYTFTAQGTEKTITDPDKKIFNLNSGNIVEQAYNYGRTGSFYKAGFEILTSTFFSKKINLDYYLDKETLKTKLEEEFRSVEQPSKNADINIAVADATKKQFEVIITPSTTGGITFDYNSAINELEKNLQQLENKKIALATKNDIPKINTAAAERLKPAVQELLTNLDSLKLFYKDDSFIISWSDFTNWVHLGLNDVEEPILVLDKTMVIGQLEAMAQTVNQEPVNGKLQMKDGKVTEFQASQNGQILNIEESYTKINNEVINNKTKEVELIVQIAEPTVKLDGTNDLGIKEIIGTGVSDFSGSPNNRRVNIGVGAASIHGTIVAPGEEFSLVKILGDVDGEAGYLPELVIKENKTIPEFGGGLCQVATTAFRAALDSGLKITERMNHSYRVVYYEPAGTDATVYIPKPDVRFLNDTEHYILFQSTIKGNTLKFDVWGTKDGRKTKFEGVNTVERLIDLKPKIFNITVPGPAKEIETTALKPGEKKKTESAHNGADTSFSRTVTFADGREEKATWNSHYVPWQAVYLIGIDPVAKEQAAKDAQALLDATNPPVVPVDPATLPPVIVIPPTTP
ncbi:MAG: VanW family protein [Parcubacteria group bacterium GW2011_GWC2_39_14]|nr:MAG: VanW family protein [Parcubacteria group bacterium GW2011_GWC2_39_14]KKR54118.1 MAG: VanW family protein [Parcubacteria group bacterium GW2011_GWA2_40_23]